MGSGLGKTLTKIEKLLAAYGENDRRFICSWLARTHGSFPEIIREYEREKKRPKFPENGQANFPEVNNVVPVVSVVPVVPETTLLKQEELEVLQWLNAKTGKNFRAVETNLQFIRARLRTGISKYQLKAIVSLKTEEWTGTDNQIYLRPETLFGKKKCEQYLGELPNLENKDA